MRQSKVYLWAHPDDCNPPHGLDMQSTHDAEKVAWLTEAFKNNGFDLSMPALVGYPNEGMIQLLSGTHRHLAAKQAGILLPITLWLKSDIEERWGTELWDDVIKDIPVKELEEVKIIEGFVRSPYDRVDLSNLKD